MCSSELFLKTFHKAQFKIHKHPVHDSQVYVYLQTTTLRSTQKNCY
jgi:hypothetical protein